MTLNRNGQLEAHEFTVRATPLKLAEYSLTVFVIHDISATKRRDVLENIFIHDLNNIITGLRGWSEILIKRPADAPHIAQKIVDLSTHLTQEVENQRLLLQAERGELQVTLEPVSVKAVLEGIRTFFSGYPPDKTHRIKIQDYKLDTTVTTSQPLLLRVLANMVKNALEATSSSDMVQVRFELSDNSFQFIIHNPGEIQENVALQIFNRSFSTKGTAGRGLGTYSMKLFGEQYIGGVVDFKTGADEGTVFRITLPR
jgi:signal transduction histidine kinase